MKDVIHFAHGNGFPSSCYAQLLQRLQPEFEIGCIEKIGHDREFPITDNWHYLIDEVIESIRAQASKPVIALGHSLGGVLSLLAAIKCPALFQFVIVLDSPFMGRLKSQVVRFSKAIGMIDRLTPAHRTRLRQQHWSSRAEAYAYLKSRVLFKSFSEACLNDYIDFGLLQDEKGYTLRFDRNIEYQIYRTIPHTLPDHEGQLKTPTALIYGERSTVIDRTDLRYMKQSHGIQCIKMKGTHMFPMEHPDLTAEVVRQTIQQMRGQAS